MEDKKTFRNTDEFFGVDELNLADLDGVAGGQKWGQNKSVTEKDKRVLRRALAAKAGNTGGRPANADGDGPDIEIR